MEKLQILCNELLNIWCNRLYLLQSTDGSIFCDACNIVHGRCFDAMYPFLYLYKDTRDEKWHEGAIALFEWAEKNVSKMDGSYINDVDSEWTGTTVFTLIQLIDSLIDFGYLLNEQERIRISNRAREAADYLCSYHDLKTRNINYPISNALALFLAYRLWGDLRYKEASDDFIEDSLRCISEDGLLYGEGRPREKITKKGCRPIDIGYNLEESIPAIIRLATESENSALLDIGNKLLANHLYFILSDGGIDNSFGTRNFKWTYYGSRTSDGMLIGLLLLKDKDPLYIDIALKNLELQKECTVDGLLAGGLDYRIARQKACVHHSFTHVKTLALILQKKLYKDCNPSQNPILKRYRNNCIKYFKSLDSAIMISPQMSATITAYDWVYIPEGHPSGGTVSLLHHKDAGIIIASSMNQYMLKEKRNMQIPSSDVLQECLSPRIDNKTSNKIFSSVYDFDARLKISDTYVESSGTLKILDEEGNLPYRFYYELNGEQFHIKGTCDGGVFILPIVIRPNDQLLFEDNRIIIIRASRWRIEIYCESYSMPYGEKTIFNLIPGLEAIRIDVKINNSEFDIDIRVEEL